MGRKCPYLQHERKRREGEEKRVQLLNGGVKGKGPRGMIRMTDPVWGDRGDDSSDVLKIYRFTRGRRIGKEDPAEKQKTGNWRR